MSNTQGRVLLMVSTSVPMNRNMLTNISLNVEHSPFTKLRQYDVAYDLLTDVIGMPVNGLAAFATVPISECIESPEDCGYTQPIMDCLTTEQVDDLITGFTSIRDPREYLYQTLRVISSIGTKMIENGAFNNTLLSAKALAAVESAEPMAEAFRLTPAQYLQGIRGAVITRTKGDMVCEAGKAYLQEVEAYLREIWRIQGRTGGKDVVKYDSDNENKKKGGPSQPHPDIALFGRWEKVLGIYQIRLLVLLASYKELWML